MDEVHKYLYQIDAQTLAGFKKTTENLEHFTQQLIKTGETAPSLKNKLQEAVTGIATNLAGKSPQIAKHFEKLRLELQTLIKDFPSAPTTTKKRLEQYRRVVIDEVDKLLTELRTKQMKAGMYTREMYRYPTKGISYTLGKREPIQYTHLLTQKLNPAFIEYRKNIDKTIAIKKQLNKIFDLTNRSMALTSRSAGKVGESFDEATKKSADFYARTAVGIMILYRLQGALSGVIKLYEDYEKSLAVIRSLTGMTADETIALGDDIIEMSRKVPATAEEMSKIYNDILQSIDLTKEEALDLVSIVVKLAKATGAEAERVTTVMTGILNAFKMSVDEAENLAGQLVMTWEVGVITLEEMEISMGKLAQAAKLAGSNEREMLAMLIGITREGGKAQTNATMLGRTLVDISAPKNIDKLRKIGITLAGTSDVLGMLTQISKAFQDEERKRVILTILGNKLTRQGITLLVNELPRILKEYNRLAEAQGVLGEKFATSTDTMLDKSVVLGNILRATFKNVGKDIVGVKKAIGEVIIFLDKLFEPLRAAHPLLAGLSGLVRSLLTFFGLLAGAGIALGVTFRLLNIEIYRGSGAFTGLIIALVKAAGALWNETWAVLANTKAKQGMTAANLELAASQAGVTTRTVAMAGAISKSTVWLAVAYAGYVAVSSIIGTMNKNRAEEIKKLDDAIARYHRIREEIAMLNDTNKTYMETEDNAEAIKERLKKQIIDLMTKYPDLAEEVGLTIDKNLELILANEGVLTSVEGLQEVIDEFSTLSLRKELDKLIQKSIQTSGTVAGTSMWVQYWRELTSGQIPGTFGYVSREEPFDWDKWVEEKLQKLRNETVRQMRKIMAEAALSSGEVGPGDVTEEGKGAGEEETPIEKTLGKIIQLLEEYREERALISEQMREGTLSEIEAQKEYYRTTKKALEDLIKYRSKLHRLGVTETEELSKQIEMFKEFVRLGKARVDVAEFYNKIEIGLFRKVTTAKGIVSGYTGSDMQELALRLSEAGLPLQEFIPALEDTHKILIEAAKATETYTKQLELKLLNERKLYYDMLAKVDATVLESQTYKDLINDITSATRDIKEWRKEFDMVSREFKETTLPEAMGLFKGPAGEVVKTDITIQRMKDIWATYYQKYMNMSLEDIAEKDYTKLLLESKHPEDIVEKLNEFIEEFLLLLLHRTDAELAETLDKISIKYEKRKLARGGRPSWTLAEPYEKMRTLREEAAKAYEEMEAQRGKPGFEEAKMAWQRAENKVKEETMNLHRAFQKAYIEMIQDLGENIASGDIHAAIFSAIQTFGNVLVEAVQESVLQSGAGIWAATGWSALISTAFGFLTKAFKKSTYKGRDIVDVYVVNMAELFKMFTLATSRYFFPPQSSYAGSTINQANTFNISGESAGLVKQVQRAVTEKSFYYGLRRGMRGG